MDLAAVRNRLDAERCSLVRAGDIADILPSVTRLQPEGGAFHTVPTSRPILERLGFVHLTDTWPGEWNP